MRIVSDTKVKNDGLIEFVRSGNPVTTSVAPTSREGRAMLERVLRATKTADMSQSHIPLPRRRLVVVTAVLVAAAAGVGGAFASGLISLGSPKVADVASQAASGQLVAKNGVQNAAQAVAASQKVTDIKVAAATANGNVGIVEGVRNGAIVAVATSGTGTGLFAPTTVLLDWAGGLYVQTAASGSSLDTVDEVDISGIASAEAATVNLIGKGGTNKPLELSEMSDGSKAFAVTINPVDFEVTSIVAYTASGKQLVRKAIPAGTLTPPEN